MTSPRNLRQNLFILIYSILFGLSLGEFAVRVLDLSKTWTTKQEVQKHELIVEKYFDHAEIGHRYLPGSTFISILDKPYSINKDGFRDIEFEQDTDRVLIAFLGSSIIEGLGVHINERATDTARSLMRETLGDAIEVYNFGIGASSSYDELHILQNHVLKYRPKYVVLQVGFNDLASNWNTKNKKSTTQDEAKNGENPQKHNLIKTFLQNHSALYLYLAESYNARLLRDNQVNPVLNKVLAENTEEWNLLFQLLKEFQDNCNRQGTKPVIMYIPYEAEVLISADSLGTRTNKKIEDFCLEQHIGYIEVLESLRNAQDKELLYFDFTHQTAYGNSITGQAIAAYFVDNEQD